MRPSVSEDRLAGLRALVAGGAGGIGSAIVRQFMAAGAEVVVVDIDQEGLDRLQAELSPCSVCGLT